jgi:drug/metabolite transporter (DMT)-like permease
VVVAALLFSTGGAAIKTQAFATAQVSCVRSGIAAIVVLLWLRGRVSRAMPVVATSTAYASTLLLFVAATKLTTAAAAIVLQSTAPLYLLLLGPRLLGEPIHWRHSGYMAAAGVGLLMAVAGQPLPSHTAPNPSLGDTLGMLSGLAWSLTLVGLRRVQRTSLTKRARRGSREQSPRSSGRCRPSGTRAPPPFVSRRGPAESTDDTAPVARQIRLWLVVGTHGSSVQPGPWRATSTSMR